MLRWGAMRAWLDGGLVAFSPLRERSLSILVSARRRNRREPPLEVEMKIAVSCICASVVAVGSILAETPCNDSLYLALKRVPLNVMSQREYDYFMLKEKYCLDAAKDSRSAPADTGLLRITVAGLGAYQYDPGRDFLPVIRAMKIYVDDIAVGAPPRATIRIAPGPHVVSLFPSFQLSAEGPWDKQRLGTAFVKVNVAADQGVEVRMRMLCDVGGNGTCDGNEWSFTAETERLLPAEPVGKLLHVAGTGDSVFAGTIEKILLRCTEKIYRNPGYKAEVEGIGTAGAIYSVYGQTELFYCIAFNEQKAYIAKSKCVVRVE